jgi:hypothetical protein
MCSIYYKSYAILYIIACYCISPQCGGADLATLQFRDLTNKQCHTYVYIYIYIYMFFKLPNVFIWIHFGYFILDIM